MKYIGAYLLTNTYLVNVWLGGKIGLGVVFIDKVVLAGVTVESSHLGFLQGQLTARKCLRARHDPAGLREIHNALVCSVLWPVYYYYYD